MYKSIIKLFFLFSLMFAILIIVSNYVIDPFQQYRQATFYKVMYYKERYLDAGLAKNYSYDSVLIGSSMTENFRINDMSEILNFSKPIKLTSGGGSIFEEMIILQTALDAKKVKNVLFGFDIFALATSKKDNKLPLYLYDQNILNDIKYLFNLDTLKYSMTYPVLSKIIGENSIKFDPNRMFAWDHQYSGSDYGKTNVKLHWDNRENFLSSSPEKEYSYSYMKINFDKIVMPIITKYKNVNFIFFYPPYSILTYKSIEERGWIKDYIKIKNYISKTLSGYPHVSIYDFQNAKEITHNLNNYKDMSHYHPRINVWILDQIKNSYYKVKGDRVEKINEKLLKQIHNYSLDNIRE